MDVSIVIVSWNVKDKLRENLISLFKSEKITFEVIVVDNASSDGTVEMVQTEFEKVKVVVNEINFGFAKASNQGITLAEGRYVILLNPDMKLERESLARTVDWLDANQQASVAGIKLIDEKGNIVPQVRRFPHLFDQLMIVLKFVHLFPSLLNEYLRSDFNYEKAAKVDSIRGAFFAIRRSTLEKIGSLDERYFLWFEEVDYCRQLHQAGLEVWYTPAATALDFVGQSFNQLKRSTKQKYFRNSMIAYFKKWEPTYAALLIQIAWLPGTIIARLADLLRVSSRTRT